MSKLSDVQSRVDGIESSMLAILELLQGRNASPPPAAVPADAAGVAGYPSEAATFLQASVAHSEANPSLTATAASNATIEFAQRRGGETLVSPAVSRKLDTPRIGAYWVDDIAPHVMVTERDREGNVIQTVKDGQITAKQRKLTTRLSSATRAMIGVYQAEQLPKLSLAVLTPEQLFLLQEHGHKVQTHALPKHKTEASGSLGYGSKEKWDVMLKDGDNVYTLRFGAGAGIWASFTKAEGRGPSPEAWVNGNGTASNGTAASNASVNANGASFAKLAGQPATPAATLAPIVLTTEQRQAESSGIVRCAARKLISADDAVRSLLSIGYTPAEALGLVEKASNGL